MEALPFRDLCRVNIAHCSAVEAAAMSPAVSIIVPTFNRPQFLAPALESVFAQTFADWELIIADDGSSVNTRAYLQSVADPPRVKVIWLSHSGRPGVVRNAALREARGEYIAFLDSDDLWLPQKLAVQIASLRRHAGRGWSYTKFAVVDVTGAPSVLPRSKYWAAPSGWILDKILKEETVIALPSVIVVRQLLEQLGAFDEELVMCEDDELWLRLAAHTEIDGIEAPLTLVRRHSQHSGSDITAWRDRRRVFEKALQANAGGRHEAILRKLRVDMALGLAKSQAAFGKRASALRTLFSSVPYSWRYRAWWHGALVALGRAFAPASLQGLMRRYRYRKRPHSEPLPP
jgi:glycosyltransferase involved in cell wall biosynthesis